MKKSLFKLFTASLMLAGFCFIISKPVMAEEVETAPDSVTETSEIAVNAEDTPDLDVEDTVTDEPTMPSDRSENEVYVEYSTYIRDAGWSVEKADGVQSNVINRKKPIEGISIQLGSLVEYEGGIEYRTSSNGVHWSTETQKNGEITGNIEDSNPIELIQIQLFGEVAEYYDVYYRAYSTYNGWNGWAKNWSLCGTHGKNYMLSALQIKLVLKDAKVKPAVRKAFTSFDKFNSNNLVEYEIYTKTGGWQKIQYDNGIATAATAQKIEGLKINKSDGLLVDGDIFYKTYSTENGWEENYATNGALTGTDGEGLRLELIKIGLNGLLGEMYDVYYRVYISGIGWMHWASNDEEAGFADMSTRNILKFQMQLVTKGSKAPGYVKNPVYMNKLNYAKKRITDTIKGKYANHYEEPYASQFTAIKTQLTTVAKINLLKKEKIDSLIEELKEVTSKLTYKKGSAPTVFISTDSGRGNSITKGTGYITTTIAVLDEKGKLIENIGQVKVRGNSTAGAAKKAYTIKFDSKENVLGMGKAKKWALLANCYDPTGLRNSIAFDMAEELGLPYTSEHEFVEVYVDGKLKGMYLLAEPVEEGKTRVNIDLDAGDFLIERERSRYESDGQYIVLSNGLRFNIKEPEATTKDEIKRIKGIMNDIVKVMNTGTFEEVSQVVDIDSFSKFYLLNEYVKTMDIDFSSVFFYYKGGKLYAGPVWDYDLGMGNNGNWYNLNTTSANGWTAKLCGLFKPMCKFTEFMDYTKNVFMEHNDYFANIAADGGQVDTYVKKYQTLINRNMKEAGWSCARRYGVYTGTIKATYQGNIDVLKNWLKNRYVWMSNHFGNAEGAVNYATYNKTDKWLSAVRDGVASGPESTRSIKMEGLIVTLNSSIDGDILYKSCLSTSGWETEWKKNGEVSGLPNTVQKIEAVVLDLSDNLKDKYDLVYRVRRTGLGWTAWVAGGETAGVPKSLRAIEAIEIQLVEKI